MNLNTNLYSLFFSALIFCNFKAIAMNFDSFDSRDQYWTDPEELKKQENIFWDNYYQDEHERICDHACKFDEKNNKALKRARNKYNSSLKHNFIKKIRAAKNHKK